MANILVTGGAGFIGYHLVKKLRSLGHKVIALDSGMNPCNAPDNEYVYGDVRYSRDLERYIIDCDFVFHLAAQISVDKSIINPQETIDINITGTQNVLEVCKKFKVPMIFASSSEIYGTSQFEYMDENHPLDAQSPYAASKVAGDRLCHAYWKTYGKDVRILRNFNTAGPYQCGYNYGAVIAKFIKSALNGNTLYIFGRGTQQRDYMHVSDAVEAYITVMNEGYPGIVVNAGSGKTININDIAKKVLKETKSNSKIEHRFDRAGEVQRLCCDNRKIKTFGWKPKKDIDKIIKDMVKTYNNPTLYIDGAK